VSCLLCGRELNEGGRDDLGSPSSGYLRFYTRGSIQSGAFNPGDHQADCEHLLIAICDDCLRDAGELGLVQHGKLEALPGDPLPGEWEYTRWRVWRRVQVPVLLEDE
jgi:hypothetical protein